MNKYLYILGFAGAALFSACSTSDDLSIEESSAVDKAKESVLIFEAGQNSEVPISLGIGQSRGNTRMPLEPADDISNLGVFCLATETQTGVLNIPSAVKNNKWSKDKDGELGGLLVRMNNIPASVSSGDVTFGLSGDEDYYYPEANWMKYNFYAYYPRQEETVTIESAEKTTLVISDDQVYEKFYKIDGSQDIIWGKANPVDAGAPSGAKPYSAEYFRWRENNIEAGKTIADYYPQFSFEHKLVQFKFYLKADNSIVKAKIKQVRDMYITNGINYLELVVADKNKPEKNGNLYWFGNSLKTERMYIKLDGTDKNRFHQDGDSPDNPLDNISDENNVYVGYIMLAPPSLPGFNATFNNTDNTASDEEFVYKLKVRVKCKGSTSDFYPVYKLTPPDEGFQEGKTYKIVIIIKESDLV